jgi:WD repeat and SOF domain-containing protein 1
MLRLGGGLDNGERIRRDPNASDRQYIYVESTDSTPSDADLAAEPPQAPMFKSPPGRKSTDPNEGLLKKKGAEWEPKILLPEPLHHTPARALPSPCDPENPRIFHMFWTGLFTDKPYLALMSFLFSQNTGLHLKEWPADAKVCRPPILVMDQPRPCGINPQS